MHLNFAFDEVVFKRFRVKGGEGFEKFDIHGISRVVLLLPSTWVSIVGSALRVFHGWFD